eukprot:COSAG01_NODE_4409_length_5056_cov_1.452895_3_plen_105_part_00
MFSQIKLGKNKAKIVQFSDDKKTLPDGSKIIYAESDHRLVLYHKPAFEKSTSYVFNRKTGQVKVDGKVGMDTDKKKMLSLGAYFIKHAEDQSLVTIDVNLKGSN